MLWLIVLHCAAACCAPLLVRWLGSRAFLLLALAPAAAAVWAGVQYPKVVGSGEEVSLHWAWIPNQGVELGFRLDSLSLLMTLIAGGVGALVMVYCAGYFRSDEPRLGRFAGTLTAFAGAMLGLVLSDDLIVLYVWWELTTIFSFLLIGHNPETRTNRRAALQALIVTTLGGLVMLIGFLMLGHEAGTFRISELVENPPEANALVSIALVLVLVGALSKSAIWPFSLWLPGAMAAPTPVSAYLHAAAMVKGGIYLIARLAPAFADVVPWRGTVLVLGGLTMLLGGWRALRETDLKRILAFGTVSQLGFLTMLVGDGHRDTELAGLAMLLAHALFKAALFLTVGLIDRTTGTRDVHRLSGLGRKMPWVCTVAVLAGASMAGVPPLFGFAAKEAALESLLHEGPVQQWALAAIVVGSGLTAAYTLRFLWGAFASKPGAEPIEVLRRPGAALFVPGAAVVLVSLAFGPGAVLLDPLLSDYAGSFPAVHNPLHMEFWHGIGLAFGLSAVTWVLGAALFALNRPIAKAGDQLAVLDGEHAFAHSLWGLERFSLQTTGIVQRGSLPFYLGTALAVLIGAQLVALVVDRPWEHVSDVRLYDSTAQLAVSLAVCAVAVLCVRARQRMKAVVLAGVTGYGAAVLFVLHGAPDIALTQFAVETVSIIVFVLVLRRLPPRFPVGPAAGRMRRVTQIVFGVAAGTFAAGLTYIAASARVDEPAGPLLSQATEDHGLKNVVATTLVDLRAWDTMGESSVLAVAAVGVTSLVYLRRRSGTPASPAPSGAPPNAALAHHGHRSGTAHPEEHGGRPAEAARTTGQQPHVDTRAKRAERWPKPDPIGRAPRRTWLAASSTLAPERRSVVFEVVARLVFHPIVVLSLFLLFCAENLPGGGFTAGLVASLALGVRYLAGGRHELANAAPVDAGFLLGVGLLTITLTGLGGLLFTGSVLGSGTFHGHLPVIGDFHAASPVLFDTGVYLLVLGVVLDVLRSLGSEIDRRVERELRRAPNATAEGGATQK
ncbi:Na+/H+ antiporter subunit A [Streptomyces xiaopingdaonensis]|uniref:Na+/H+ antiporter subunit A n=1 Tax=Streptomyces xiaopingdaonensis TaxID=1565415 RepID=UPI0003104253|nr:Na+/H+ antiporter subunit A [Streptomyces xiaopingdaonensis]